MLNLKETFDDLPATGTLPGLVRKAPVYHDRWWMTEDGLRHYARDYPAASGRVRLPVICLHGLTRSSTDFEDVAPWIAQADRRVIVPDFRGRGLSENDPDAMNYHLWTYAKDILALCDAFGIGQAIFIGSSMGGLVAMVLSTLRPTLIKSAVLNDIGPVLSRKGLARISEFVTAPHMPMRNWAEAGAFTAERYAAAFPNHTQADWLKMAHRLFRKGRDGYLHLAYDPRITAAFKGMTLSVNSYEMAPCYASLAANRRLMLVRGAVSDVLDASEAKKMAAQCKAFTRIDIANVGHAPDLTEPQARAALMAFLESQV